MTKENAPTIMTVNGVRFVVIAEAEYVLLVNASSKGGQVPLPLTDANGNFPARETIRAMLANKLRERRVALGLSQAQLAELAGVRIETVNRLESAKHAPHAETVKRLEDAMERAARRAKPKRVADSAIAKPAKRQRTKA